MVTSVNLSISLPPLANFSYNSFKIKRKAKKSPVNPMGHIGTFKTLEHTIMGNKELNAREWAKQKDAFCIEHTQYRCETCGAENVKQSKFCRECRLPLGWLRPILKKYESTTEGSKLTPIHISGWGNIEESLPIDKLRDVVPAYKELAKKYRGHDLVETILEREKEVKQIEIGLTQELVSLSEQKVFLGKCQACLS
jgi:hypothetical protein